MGGARTYAQTINQNVGNVTVPPGKTISGSIHLNVGKVVVQGTVDGSIQVNVGTVQVESSGLVKGNVRVNTGNIIAPQGKILGTRSVGVGNAQASHVTAVVAGGNPFRHWTSFVPDWHTGSLGFPFVGGWGWTSRFLGKLVMNLIVSGILVVLFPRMIRRIVTGIEDAPVRAAAVGCLTLVAWVVAMIGLAIIIIGIPLTILLALAGAVAALVANGAVIWLVGSRVLRGAFPVEPPAWYLVILAGGSIVTLVEIVPGIGWLAELAVMVVGVGAIVQSRFGFARPQWPEL